VIEGDIHYAFQCGLMQHQHMHNFETKYQDYVKTLNVNIVKSQTNLYITADEAKDTFQKQVAETLQQIPSRIQPVPINNKSVKTLSDI